ncbi:desulfoferrodoxin [Candidatus Peregrinibacteria bacterium]|jgi:superoxide reductase|nr:desulfoferrodoxin [Candidatus Peregrinibacteria bacterium]MBT7484638.1 desulfoferrodoxin [Candidatus Peregrinibacteria bacterium]
MTNLNENYKCFVCGNIVGVMHPAAGELVCCNQPMRLLTENTEDAAEEKHVPIIEKTATGYKVTVGSIEHPMQDDHFIEWIELEADGQIHRKYLKPGELPMAEFEITAEKITAREFCNLHGLWKAEF